ncbi:helix-turn-helix domain-containing protein [Asanoa sp. WMMD1127]|uniref:winged helix-turn-helix transcriptional regulator n=1 Tax=Asanoa sp. WMMD1127 TaxID=3016107 RepID=UPI002416FB84|nr:helix-turn-helix domain-containing protein [Asanoa sp. WMMD1127]MDG4825049.1 helix-turn-helix domain-containing protein [Asanoa sp. WMMD1127]
MARTFDIIGEPWTALIVRDVYAGIVRFEDLKRDLGISRKVLAERLGRLLEKEILRRHQYSDRPPRFEYLLTEKGFDLCAVLLAAMAWGDRWTAGPAGPPVLLRHQACGEVTHAVLRCAGCGQPLDATDVDLEDGTR